MGNSIIFHGPGSLNQVLLESKGCFYTTIGGVGKKISVDDVRSITSISLTPFPGGKRTVIIGPVDEIPKQSCDPLLKVIEETAGVNVNINLWAIDISSVPDTIRSRCSSVWCGGDDVIDDNIISEAGSIVGAVLDRDVSFIQRNIFKMKEWDIRHYKGMASSILFYIKHDKRMISMWLKLRDVLKNENPTYIEVLNVVLWAATCK